MKIVVIGFLGVASLIALSLAIFIAANWAPDRAAAGLKARWAPAPSTFLDAADMRVHLRDEGPKDDKSPIVLLHGTGSSLHAWEGWGGGPCQAGGSGEAIFGRRLIAPWRQNPRFSVMAGSPFQGAPQPNL